MMPSPPDTATIHYLRRQAEEVRQQSRHLHLSFQQAQCHHRAVCEESYQARRRSCEQHRHSQQLRQDLSSARQRIQVLLDRQLLAAAPSRPAASLQRHSPQKLDDLALIQYCKTGERSAWNELVHRFEPMIFSFAHSLCNNATDAADITAEVYVRLFHRLHTFRREATSFKSWLFRIIHNTYVDVCIRDSNHGHLSLDAPLNPEEPGDSHEVVDPSPTPELLCLDKDQVRRLSEGIRTLPSYQWQVLVLFLQGRSYEEITVETGLSMGTVKSRINRARKTLWERFQHEEKLPEQSRTNCLLVLQA